MKEFDRELFDSLCEKYGAVMSNDYDQPMFKNEDGSIVPFEEKHVKRMIKEKKYDSR